MGPSIIVIVISKLLKLSARCAPDHQLIHERCDESKGFTKGGQEKLGSDFQSTRRGQSSC